jgi:hypothetical protein
MPIILAAQEAENQEARGLKPAQTNSLQDPFSKKNHHRKGLVEWLKL